MSEAVEQKLNEKGHARLATVAAFVRDGKILVGFRHYTKDKWKTISVWTMPGGRCDESETVEVALRREVEEEVGFKNFEITGFLGEVPGAKEGDTLYVFRCVSHEEPKLMEAEKFSEWKWISIDELPENVINPESFELIK